MTNTVAATAAGRLPVVPADPVESTEELKRSTLDLLAGDTVGVYEVWWIANGLDPDRPASQRLAAAEQVVAALTDEGVVTLLRGRWTGPRAERTPIPTSEVTEVLRAWSTWVPQEENVIWMDPLS